MSASEPIYAPAPFDDPLGDLIIRSADGIDFRVFKIDLIRSSPVFKDMMSLPQSPDSRARDEHRDGMPVVPVSESAYTLTLFLRFCAVGSSPALESFADVIDVMAPARKYQPAAIERSAALTLISLAEAEPVRAYALGCVYGMEDVARAAALYSLRHPPTALVEKASPELDLASAQDLRRLLDYRHKCAKAVSSYMSSWTNPGCGSEIQDWDVCQTREWCFDRSGN